MTIVLAPRSTAVALRAQAPVVLSAANAVRLNPVNRAVTLDRRTRAIVLERAA